MQGCAFEGCSGAGYRVDLHDWDSWGTPGEGWPRRSDLQKGLRCEPPLDDEDELADTLFDTRTTLNRDVRRRDEILGVRSDDRDDLTRFSGLDLVGLALLLQERFIDPDEQHNAGPPVSECLQVMSRCPEIQVHGYALHPSREDYRVSIEGYQCALEGEPNERHAALRREMERVSGGADEYIDRVDQLYAWWD